MMNNKDFPYHRRMTQLMNRTVRTYDASTGKSALAQDEFLEVCNRDLQQMPPVRTLDGRMRQGFIVGPAKRCRRVVDAFYTPGAVESTVYRHGSGSKGNLHLEKDLLFEVAGLFLGMRRDNDQRTLRRNSVSSLACRITTELKRNKLAREMTDRGDDETNRLFNSVSHMQDNSRRVVADDIIDDSPHGAPETYAVGDESEAAMEQIEIRDEIDESSEEEHSGAVHVNKRCISDLWSQGWYSIDCMNISKTRERQEHRLKCKKRMQKAVLSLVKQMKEDACNAVVIDEEKEPELQAPWATMIRSLDLARYAL